MKASFSPLVVAILLAGSLVQAETREFTSTNGRKVTAEMIGFADGKARLKTQSGETFEIALSALSEADREYVDLWSTAPGNVPITPDMNVDEYLLAQGYDSVVYDDEKLAMIIEVTIADRPHKFIINTALPYSYLEGTVADVLGLKTKPTGDVLTSASGAQVSVSEGKIDNFKLGHLVSSRIFRVANLVQTGINPKNLQVDGVLGFDFLQEYGVLLNYKQKRFYFTEPRS